MAACLCQSRKLDKPVPAAKKLVKKSKEVKKLHQKPADML